MNLDNYTFIVSGEATIEEVNESDKEAELLLWDSYHEGITTVCLMAKDDLDAIRLAKKFYGMQECSVEQCY